MAVFCQEAAVPAAATALHTLLGITAGQGKNHWSKVIIRNNPAAANDAYFGNSSVTTTTNRGGVLRATDTMPHEIDNGGGGSPNAVDITKIFIIGTVNAANIIFVTLVT